MPYSTYNSQRPRLRCCRSSPIWTAYELTMSLHSRCQLLRNSSNIFVQTATQLTTIDFVTCLCSHLGLLRKPNKQCYYKNTRLLCLSRCMHTVTWNRSIPQNNVQKSILPLKHPGTHEHTNAYRRKDTPYHITYIYTVTSLVHNEIRIHITCIYCVFCLQCSVKPMYKGRCGVFAGNSMWSTSERLVVELLTIGAIQVHFLSFPFLNVVTQ